MPTFLNEYQPINTDKCKLPNRSAKSTKRETGI